MKRFISILLTAVLLCGCTILNANAEIEKDLAVVHCAEQKFTTRVPASMRTFWDESTGLNIAVGTPGKIPYLLVYRRDVKLNDPVNYLNNVVREHMEEKYGANMIGTNPCRVFTLEGGRTLYGARYHYLVNGIEVCMFRLVEVRPEGDVEFQAKYTADSEDKALAALEIAIQYYEADTAAV